MKIKRRIHQTGVSLVELLIYMGLSFILLTVILGLLISIFETRTESDTTTSVEQNSRYLLNRLRYDIHRSQDMLIPANAGDTSDRLQVVIDGSIFTYRVIDATLYMIEGTDQIALTDVNTQVGGFGVSRYGNTGGAPSAQLVLSLSSGDTEGSNTESQDYQFTFGLR